MRTTFLQGSIFCKRRPRVYQRPTSLQISLTAGIITCSSFTMWVVNSRNTSRQMLPSRQNVSLISTFSATFQRPGVNPIFFPSDEEQSVWKRRLGGNLRCRGFSPDYINKYNTISFCLRCKQTERIMGDVTRSSVRGQFETNTCFAAAHQTFSLLFFRPFGEL